MAIEWIVLIILVILGSFFIKFEHHLKKSLIILAVIAALVIYFSITGVFNSGNVDLTSPKGIVSAVYFYAGWMGSTISSLWNIGTETVSMVGNAIKIDKDNEDEKR